MSRLAVLPIRDSGDTRAKRIKRDHKIPEQIRHFPRNIGDKSVKHRLNSARLRNPPMKSIIPDSNQLDELAAGLDAGWDAEPAETSPSRPPHSAPLPEALDALDADWGEPAEPAAASSAQVSLARSTPARAGQARPSPTRPSPNRAVTAVGAAPSLASKQERREAERKRRAHEAQQKTSNKKERKAERQAEARRQGEQLRAVEQQAAAERSARTGERRKRAQAAAAVAAANGATSTKRSEKRARREQAAAATSVQAIAPAPKSSIAPAIVEERGLKKLLPLILIAALVAVTLGFALSRAH